MSSFEEGSEPAELRVYRGTATAMHVVPSYSGDRPTEEIEIVATAQVQLVALSHANSRPFGVLGPNGMETFEGFAFRIVGESPDPTRVRMEDRHFFFVPSDFTAVDLARAYSLPLGRAFGFVRYDVTDVISNEPKSWVYYQRKGTE